MGMSIDDTCGLGINARDIVMLDFDEEKLENVKYWATRACNWFNLGGFIILESSEMSYHAVSYTHLTLPTILLV